MKESIIDIDILFYYLKGDRKVIQNVLTYLDAYPT